MERPALHQKRLIIHKISQRKYGDAFQKSDEKSDRKIMMGISRRDTGVDGLHCCWFTSNQGVQ